MRSPIVKELLDGFKDYLRSEKPSPSLAQQLGYYAGTYICNEYLPTLSIFYETSRNMISVTWDERKEYERLNEFWLSDDDDNAKKEGFKQVGLYVNKMMQKYLPPILECYIPTVYLKPDEISDFKRGVSLALWDCDYCCYKIETNDDIHLDGDYGKYSLIKLFLDKNIFLK